MSPEGGLRLQLGLREGRIERLSIDSTRPDVAQRLLQGRRIAEVAAAVPRLFAVCAISQAAASRLALAAAGGGLPGAERVAALQNEVAGELLREAAWHVLLHWPQWAGETPSAAATAAARAITAAQGRPELAALAEAVFAGPAESFLALDSWAALQGWAAVQHNATARFMHALRNSADAVPAGRPVPLLSLAAPGTLEALAAAAAADPDFARQPVWQGLPTETGALARLPDDALVGAAAAPAPSRLLARHVARLRELALLLAGRRSPGLGALVLGSGSGVAWVDNARGLLVHHVQLEGDRVRVYRLIAPTEWNFHPRGALHAALMGAQMADAAAARRAALREVHSLDPCVACQVEVADA